MGGVVSRFFNRRHRRAVKALAVFGPLLGFALGGCSSVPSMPSVSSMFGSSTGAQANASADAPLNFECPSITVRPGAATMSSYANPADQTAMNLRYQVGIGQTARDCKLANNIVTMRIGIQGRVVVGPQGAAGQIDVPVRLAVVHEGTNPKTITTKLERVSVTLQPDSGNVAFTLVDNEMSFPMPRGADIDDYVVYIGFDPQGLELERKKQPAKPAPRPRRPA